MKFLKYYMPIKILTILAGISVFLICAPAYSFETKSSCHDQPAKLKKLENSLKVKAKGGNPEDEALVGYFYMQYATNSQLAEIARAQGQKQFIEHYDRAATEWYRKAAEKGYAIGQYWLGLSYIFARSGKEDRREAKKWLAKSADQGLSGAQYKLGTLALIPFMGEEFFDEKAGLLWIQKAANQGHDDAAHDLGEIYKSGCCGLKQDFIEAAFWHRVSQNLKTRKPVLDGPIRKKLDTKQLEAIEKRLREWKPAPSPVTEGSKRFQKLMEKIEQETEPRCTKKTARKKTARLIE